MLNLLHIENIAVIECADITFEKGFNILTGETGAGKSIVIDAISAVLGERAYRDMIRTGADKASVRGVFSGVPHFPWFEENNVPYDDEIVIHREIFLDGRNLCRVNGTAVTVSILKKLGIQLINIHGQHDCAALFDEGSHLPYLDVFAETGELLDTYRKSYDNVSLLRQEIDRMTMDESEKLRRTETLRFQIEEIEKAGLRAGEDTELEDRRKVLQNAEKISDAIRSAVISLYGTDDSQGACELVSDAVGELGRLTRYTDVYESVRDTLQDLMYRLQDAASEVRDIEDGLAYSADELEQIEARLDVIHRLRRKYGASCEDILMYLENARVELDEITFADDRLHKLKEKLKVAEKDAWEKAAALHEKRRAGAALLSNRIQDELSQLDMPNVQFSCEFTDTDLTVSGADQVVFYMSANVGEALKPLSKVASGGELARIMLALKNVLAEQDSIDTLVFDEVDTGVSGRAAQKVAQKLKSVSKVKQVLCVTHLPQLAALADTHMLITKQEENGRTYTRVTALDRDGRTCELARMIGGAQITQTTLKSAAEMLQI